MDASLWVWERRLGMEQRTEMPKMSSFWRNCSAVFGNLCCSALILFNIACGSTAPAATAADPTLDATPTDTKVTPPKTDAVDAVKGKSDSLDVVVCEAEGAWGCVCTKNTDCNSGFCIDGENGKVCTKSCVTNCPKDWQCVPSGGSDLTYVCVPQFTNLCRPCTTHEECKQVGADKGENKCIPFVKEGGFTDGSFCGVACAEDKDCRTGFLCKDVVIGDAPAVKQCVPQTGECTCQSSWAALGLSTDCSRTSTEGNCTAKRTCKKNEAGDLVLTLCDAAVPSAEVCNDKIDNNCDGKVDDDNAQGCTTYYSDNDEDTYGTGGGVCSCKDPGAGFTDKGGDCNDLNKSVNPKAPEICDLLDNNCNGSTDESGSLGCKLYFKDTDGDLYGDPNNSACLCPSKKTAIWIDKAGDCDDAKPNIHPGVLELCDGSDNNCDGKTDEEGAKGCKLYFVDADKDTYGPAESGKCLCGPNKVNTVETPGDCDDNAPKAHPGAPEICNGIDDDCNGSTDDGDAVKSCPLVEGGAPGCKAGKCGVDGCKKGLFDVNNDASDGCECAADNSYGIAGGTCIAPIDVGDLPDPSATTTRSGNVMPGESGDWYKFNGKDTVDASGGCDQYDVRVKFTFNPGNQFVFDLYRGSCAGNDQICVAEVESSWSTSFYGPVPAGPQNKATAQIYGDTVKSPVPEAGGECKCAVAPGLPGMNICTDNSAMYFVRVYRKEGIAPTCDLYTIAFDNSPPK